ncbi:MAG: MFS transporter [Micrococcales bacterium]|nr:MFS transporter [Micrococcales bacterium]
MTLTLSSAAGRRALGASVVGSGMAFLDGTIVTVAAPHITEDLGGGFAAMQWVLDGYLLTLGALVLVGGSLGDLLGKRRVFLTGIVGFAVASAACGLAPTMAALVVARMIQGACAALLVPTSLALLNSVFTGGDRGRAIGAWSGLSGIFTALGPFVGGALVDAFPYGWRLAFLINLPLALLAVWLARAVPDEVGNRTRGPLLAQLDLAGAALATVGLGLVVGPLIEIQRLGALAWAGVGLGLLLLIGFVVLEVRRERTGQPPPMLPPAIFAIRTFSVANLVTFVVYGALSAATFLLTIYLQLSLGYSALAAGAAGLPITILLALGSARVGALVSRFGPRWFLVAGPALMSAGLVWMGGLRPGDGYAGSVLPALVLFSVGLVLVVAPVTTAALLDVGPQQSGTASGVNNAVARVAGLLAIAVLPAAAGISTGGGGLESGYAAALRMSAALCLVGAAVALIGFRKRNDAPHQR